MLGAGSCWIVRSPYAVGQEAHTWKSRAETEANSNHVLNTPTADVHARSTRAQQTGVLNPPFVCLPYPVPSVSVPHIQHFALMACQN